MLINQKDTIPLIKDINDKKTKSKLSPFQSRNDKENKLAQSPAISNSNKLNLPPMHIT
jgi:hypothetical protein